MHIISLPMEHFLRLFGLWPVHSNSFFYFFYAFLSIMSLIFQFWNVTILFHDFELLTMNITNIILIFAIFIKMTIFWRQRRYVKDVLIEMMDDWNEVKSPAALTVMKNHVQFSHKFVSNTIITYNLTIFMFLAAALRTYFSESVDNRVLPILAKFPIATQKSPIYEIVYLIQAILLLLAGNMYWLTDSSYVAMVLHASTKAEMLRLELDNFLNNILKSKTSAIKVLIVMHHRAIKFSKKVEKIYSGQLFLHFILATLQICFHGFIYLMTLSDNNGISTLLKNSFLYMILIFQLGIYCGLGEYLRTKSLLIAESAYLIPWYELKSTEAKLIIMFIQRAQKPLTITAGRLVVASHFTFTNIIKTSFSYLSVLRASRVN